MTELVMTDEDIVKIKKEVVGLVRRLMGRDLAEKNQIGDEK